MKYLWVDKGADADFNLGAAHGITGYFFDVTGGAKTTKGVLECRMKGKARGLYVATNWGGWDGLSAEAFSAKLKVAWLSHDDQYLRVQVDAEEHSPDWIVSLLTSCRRVMPTVGLSWTFEGMQGGWMSPLFVDKVMKLKVRLVPQCYNGAMTQVWDALAVARDLTARGFTDSIISPFYDAKALPYLWDGYAFTQGRLPR